MSDQDMVSAIVASIATDSNVLVLIRALLVNNVTNVMVTQQLQNICNILGIPTS